MISDLGRLTKIISTVPDKEKIEKLVEEHRQSIIDALKSGRNYTLVDDDGRDIVIRPKVSAPSESVTERAAAA